MFCEQCGKKIDEDSNFCEHCGTKINKQDKKNTKEKKIGLVILLFLIFIYIFSLELKYFNSPENAINNYLKNRNNNNYENVLKDLNIEEGTFTSKEAYSQIISDTWEDFSISSCEKEENSKNAICYVIIEKKNKTTEKETFWLERKEKNRLGIFADWIIKTNDIKVAKDWHLYLPKNTTGKLLGINLEEYQSELDQKEGYDCYIIPEIFIGNFKLELTLTNGIVIEKEISVSNNPYTYQINLEDIGQEQKQEMEDLGIHIIELLYNESTKKKEFSELKSKYDIKALEDTYNDLTKELEKSGLVSLQVKELKITGVEFIENNKIKIAYQMNYEYDLKYKSSEKEVEHHGSSSDKFYITTKTIECKEIEKIESLVTYFSKKY